MMTSTTGGLRRLRDQRPERGRLRPVRLRDLPAAAWVVSTQMARAPMRGWWWLVALPAMPMMLLVVAMMKDHLHHIDRRAVVGIRPPGAREITAAGIGTALLPVTLIYGAVLAGGAGWIFVIVAAATGVAVAIILLAPYPGRITPSLRPQHSSAEVHMTVAASHLGGDGTLLLAVRDYLLAHYPGVVVRLNARDLRAQRVYALLGFHADGAGHGLMTVTVPQPPVIPVESLTLDHPDSSGITPTPAGSLPLTGTLSPGGGTIRPD